MVLESPQRIEPARLEDVPEVLADLVADVASAATRLGHGLHSQTAMSLASMVRIMNCYYSNLIEGHATRPRDIESALLKGTTWAEIADLPPQTAQIETALADSGGVPIQRRDLLIEAVAHVRIQEMIDQKQAGNSLPEPASASFIQDLHRAFYDGASEAMLTVRSKERTIRMLPGAWRMTSRDDVAVGRHIPPSSERVADFMAYFEQRYRMKELGLAAKILAIPAAHHRFNYIHPFPDGNGRVSRLMSHAMAHVAGIGAHGLWSVSRGLARGLESRDEYKMRMDQADMPRQGDLDGRGNLSLRTLAAFSEWFMRICLDQITFMESLFDFGALRPRLHSLVSMLPEMKPEASKLLEEALMRGEFPRGDAARISGVPERSARRLLNKLEAQGLLGSDTPKSPMYLRFPAHSHDVLFPRLFLAAANL